MRNHKAILLATMLVPAITQAAEPPADTYFAMAVTENSHNHVGHNLLFLDFQQRIDTSKITPEVVISPQTNAQTITLDGKLDDWDTTQFTTVESRVMNNYPLSEFYDAVPVDIRIGSTWDDEHIYFAVDFEDANHDASINRNRWVYDGKKWRKQAHVKTRPGAPTHKAVNASDTLAGSESEDRVFFMFPITDKQRAFRDGGFGCAVYCHASIVDSGMPTKALVGEGVAAMHTNLPGDMADIWHWTSTRSRPMNTLKDGHLVYGTGDFNGRKGDQGSAPDKSNDEKKLKLGKRGRPAYISKRDYEKGNYQQPSFRTETLNEDDLLRITADMKFAKGISVPYSIPQPATGSRADVTAVARYNDTTHHWTVEFKRKRVTGDNHDRQFITGADATPPTTIPLVRGDVTQGKELFADKCASCHGDNGEGTQHGGHRWHYPRNQRASGSLIAKTADIYRLKRQQALAWKAEISQKRSHHLRSHHLMVYVKLTTQEAEDIAAWLQTQFIPLGK